MDRIALCGNRVRYILQAMSLLSCLDCEIRISGPITVILVITNLRHPRFGAVTAISRMRFRDAISRENSRIQEAVFVREVIGQARSSSFRGSSMQIHLTNSGSLCRVPLTSMMFELPDGL